jgi:S-adenosyl methyltransferase
VAGLPTQSNTHEVVGAVAPDARVVHIDSDPMVLVLARELLTDNGATAVIQADLRDPQAVPPYEDAGPVITNVGLWGSEDPASADSDGSRAFYCGVARKP